MKVRIFKPGKNAMQSGLAKTGNWVLQFETETARVPEPLMGWTSSNDTLNQVELHFKTAQDAVAYAEKKGWEYIVEPARERSVKPRNYGDNFRYRPPADTGR